jgi:hypothetical protein
MSLFRAIARLISSPSRPQRIQKKLFHKGSTHHLLDIFHQVNQEYFDNKIDLAITWSGSKQRRARIRRRLGSYHYRHRLIRIHRLLDHPDFPSSFIAYVVYQILHSLYPPITGIGGRRCIHHSLFKQKEREFKHYAEMKAWEKTNVHRFYGRS